MPTLELHGFSADQLPDAIQAIRDLTGDLAFAGDLVLSFDTGSTRLLTTLSGEPVPPFLRIATSSPDRAAALEARLTHRFDLEILSIRYRPRETP